MALVDTAATAARVQAELERGRRAFADTFFRLAMLLSLLLCLVILGVLLTDVMTGGWAVLSSRFTDFLTGELRSRPQLAGVHQGLVGSSWIAVFTIVLAFPIGIAAAIYLEEYASNSRLTRVIDVNIRNLAGVPSVVYGILGFAIFVRGLDWLTGGKTVMAAGITLAVLVLPIVIITSAEAIRAVPQNLREAGFGVGATRWEVIRHHVLPYAAPGIITGTILSLARALGEAAPLILVGAVQGRLGSSPGFFDLSQLKDRFTAMPIVITDWARQPNVDFRANTAAAIVVLLAVVLLANAAAILLRNHFEKGRK